MQNYKFTELKRLITVKSVVTSFNAERKKDFYFAGEMHNFWELVYVVSGEVMTTADEKVLSITQGQLIFHKPMEFHRIWSVGEKPARLCIISFDADGEGMKYFEGKLLSLSPLESERLISLASSFKKVIRGLGAEEFYDTKKFTILANKTVLEFESLLFELMDREDNNSSQKSSQEKQYEYIVSVMNEHSGEPLSQEELAKLCSLSVSNMKRIFHLYSDIGVMKYFTSIKLRRAMKLLGDGMPIIQIADELGFSSANYFHAVFKKELGMTPKEYIKKAGENREQK